MLGRFYSLHASLPTLVRDEPPPILSSRFFTLCGPHLNEAESIALQHCPLWTRTPPRSAPGIWHRWFRWESELRGALAERRAKRLGREWRHPEGSFPPDSAFLQEVAETACEESNPLSGEQRLHGARWRILEDLDRASFMTFDNLVIYLMKLQLLEQRASLSLEQGRQTLRDLRRIVETELPSGELEIP